MHFTGDISDILIQTLYSFTLSRADNFTVHFAFIFGCYATFPEVSGLSSIPWDVNSVWKTKLLTLSTSKEKRRKCYSMWFWCYMRCYHCRGWPVMCILYSYDFTVNGIAVTYVVLLPIYSQSIQFETRCCCLIENELKLKFS